MRTTVNCIMLIDDNEPDNYYHQRVINNTGLAKNIVVKDNGESALNYLSEPNADGFLLPQLIFLDINMPRINGWEFLEEYATLKNFDKNAITIVMLSTSDNIDDIEKAQSYSYVRDFKTKPLSEEMLEEILNKHF